MKKILYLVILLVLANCNYRKINYTKNSDPEIDYEEVLFLKDIDTIYSRNNTLLNNTTKNNINSKLNKFTNIDCTSIDCQLDGYGDSQYILIIGDNVIYISTTPSNGDIKHRNYKLQKKDTDTIGINSYYFNTFLLGKKIKTKEGSFIFFTHNKLQNYWSYVIQNNILNIIRLDAYKKKYKKSDSLYTNSIIPEKSINTGFSFTKIENFENFYFSDNFDNKTYDKNSPAFKKFVFQYKKNVLKNIIVVYDRPLKTDSKKNAEKYFRSRIKYSQEKEEMSKTTKTFLNKK